MNHKIKIRFFFLVGAASVLISSCVPLVCLMSGDQCKKVRFQDASGNPIKSASPAVGDPMAPAIMNSSDDNGYLVISKHWPDPNSEVVTIKAHGFHNFTMNYSEIPKIVVLQKE